jgi:hypothetical protein
VAPPNEDVGLGQDFLGQTVFGLFEGRGPDLDLLVFFEGVGDTAVDPFGIDFPDIGVLRFVDILVPNRRANHEASLKVVDRLQLTARSNIFQFVTGNRPEIRQTSNLFSIETTNL